MALLATEAALEPPDQGHGDFEDSRGLRNCRATRLVRVVPRLSRQRAPHGQLAKAIARTQALASISSEALSVHLFSFVGGPSTPIEDQKLRRGFCEVELTERPPRFRLARSVGLRRAKRSS
jgi:hypothetical protein